MLSATACEPLNCLMREFTYCACSDVRKAVGSFRAMRRRNDAAFFSAFAVSDKFDGGGVGALTGRFVSVGD